MPNYRLSPWVKHPEHIKDVARALHLDWHTTKELDKEYMREQLRRAGSPRVSA